MKSSSVLIRVTSGSFSPSWPMRSASDLLAFPYRCLPISRDTRASIASTSRFLGRASMISSSTRLESTPKECTGRVDPAVRHDLNPIMRKLSYHLRRVGRGDELTAREGSLELPNNLALPLRVQMKLQLVDQHDRLRFGDGILHFRIGLHEAPREVEHQRQDTPLAIGHLTHRNGATATVDQQLMLPSPSCGRRREYPGRYRTIASSNAPSAR